MSHEIDALRTRRRALTAAAGSDCGALQAASSYPPKYNPVFLCDGVGLGKTHLLYSIGHPQLANRAEGWCSRPAVPRS
jgi:chromosomal replication initiation ATPase DnaA